MNPIYILGVPGPEGQRPVLDGQDASTSAQFEFPFSGTSARGLVILSRNRTQSVGYKPRYIEIEGLEIRNASLTHTFRDAEGMIVPYRPNAASLFIERGEHITIRNCLLTGSGNGLFVASGETEDLQSRDILVQANEIMGNGNVNSDREHNVYTEAIGMTFEFNQLGPLRPGAMGNNIKDRSAGTVIRYNWIQGGTQQLDLVDAEGSFNQAGADPRYRSTYVYGNVIINEPSNASVVHYGGDSSITEIYRKGTLYFYHNTVIFRSDQRIRWRVALLRLDTNDEHAEVRNNIFYNSPASSGAPLSEFSFMSVNGQATLGVNWVSEGWLSSRSGLPFEGTLSGEENLVVGLDPGFVSNEAGDFELLSQSVCVDKAQPFPISIPAGFTVSYSPLKPNMARVLNGRGFDLGAFEARKSGMILAIQKGSSGQFRLNLQGFTEPFRLEISSDLKIWTEATTDQIRDGVFEFSPKASPSPQFFRVIHSL